MKSAVYVATEVKSLIGVANEMKFMKEISNKICDVSNCDGISFGRCKIKRKMDFLNVCQCLKAEQI